MLHLRDHPSEQMIELYARLGEELVPSLEEHLLVCAQRQNALREEDTFSQSLIAFLNRNQNRLCRVWTDPHAEEN
jgi:hypothetical protein